jgi:hypothetical protein
VTFIEDQQVIQAFFPDAAHPPLSIGVGIWCMIGGQHVFDSFGGKHHIKGRRKLGITVVQEKAHGSPLVLQLPHQLARLLTSPIGLLVSRCSPSDEPDACQSR